MVHFQTPKLSSSSTVDKSLDIFWGGNGQPHLCLWNSGHTGLGQSYIAWAKLGSVDFSNDLSDMFPKKTTHAFVDIWTFPEIWVLQTIRFPINFGNLRMFHDDCTPFSGVHLFHLFWSWTPPFWTQKFTNSPPKNHCCWRCVRGNNFKWHKLTTPHRNHWTSMQDQFLSDQVPEPGWIWENLKEPWN